MFGKSARSIRRRGTVALALGIALLVVMGAAAGIWFSMEHVYSTDGDGTVQSTANTAGTGSKTGASADDRTSRIDWEHWKKVNPSLIAWITIPGTPVNYPIVDAPADDPDYYLTHDVRGRFNWFGCIYRDPDCTGPHVRNTLLYGHNMGWSDRMFGSLARYTDAAFARKHRRIIVETPDGVHEYRMCAAEVVNGGQARKHVSFTGGADFAQWWNRTYRDADTRLSDRAPKTGRLLTLCTCSYHFWDNERTLVYAVPVRTA